MTVLKRCLTLKPYDILFVVKVSKIQKFKHLKNTTFPEAYSELSQTSLN